MFTKIKVAILVWMAFLLFALSGCSFASRPLQNPQPAVDTPGEVPTLIATPHSTITAQKFPLATSEALRPIEPSPLAPKLLATLGKGTITGVYPLPDGKKIIATEGNVLRIFDAATFQELGSIKSSLEYIGRVTISPDGHYAALSHFRQNISEIVDVEKQKVIDVVEGDDETDNLAFTADNQYVVFRSKHDSIRRDGRFYWLGLWNLPEKRLVFRYTKPDEPEDGDYKGWDQEWIGPAINQQGMLLAAGSSDKNIYVWDLKTGQSRFVLKGHISSINRVTFSPDGKLLASHSSDGIVRIWNLETGELLNQVAWVQKEVRNLIFSPDGKLLLADGSTWAWSLETREFVTINQDAPKTDPILIHLHKQGYFHYEPYLGSIGVVKASADGRMLAMGMHNVLLWDIKTKRLVQSLELPEGAQMEVIANLSIHPNGSLLAGETYTGNIFIWDIATGHVNWSINKRDVCQFSDDQITSQWIPSQGLNFDVDGATLIFGCADIIQLWDYTKNKSLAVLEIDQEETPTSFQLSPDGTYVYVIQRWRKSVQIWNLSTMKKEKQITLPFTATSYYQNQEQFSASEIHWPYFTRYAFDGESYQLELWNLEKSEKVILGKTSDDRDPVRFNPSGDLLFAKLNGLLYVWNISSGQLLYIYEEKFPLYSMQVNTDSSLLMGSNGGSGPFLELWDISGISEAVE